MNKPTLKEVFLEKMTLAANRGCDLISVRQKLIDRDRGVWYRSIDEIPLQTSSDPVLTVNLYNRHYEAIMSRGDLPIIDEEIVRRPGIVSTIVYQLTVEQIPVPEKPDEEVGVENREHLGNSLQSVLVDKIKQYSEDPGCAGVYVRSSLTMRLLGNFPRIEETDPADYVSDVIAKANIFLQQYGDCPIQTEYQRKRQDPNGTVTTFYEIYINDYDFSMMGKEPKDLCTYNPKKCQVMHILLELMNKMTSFELCKSLSLIMKDENGELMDCAELKF